MKKTLTTISLAVLAGNLVAQTDRPAAAQPERVMKPATPGKQQSEYVFLDDVLGAKVTMAPGSEERREAAEDNDTPDRASGELKDLIVDCRSGRAGIAVVSVGGFLGIGDKNVALPANMLRWNGEKKQFDLSASEDQLKALPSFDLDQATKRGLDNEVLVVRGNWTKAGFPNVDVDVRDASGVRDGKTDLDKTRAGEKAGDERIADKPRTGDDKVTDRAHVGEDKLGANRPGAAGTYPAGFTAPASQHCRASQVDDPAVYAQTEKFGKISKCIVDRTNWKIAYAVVSHGGTLGMGDTEYLVPMSALSCCRKGDDPALCLNQSVEQLKASAVKYEKPKNGVVDASAAERANSAYGTGKRSD